MKLRLAKASQLSWRLAWLSLAILFSTQIEVVVVVVVEVRVELANIKTLYLVFTGNVAETFKV